MTSFSVVIDGNDERLYTMLGQKSDINEIAAMAGSGDDAAEPAAT